MALEGMTQGMSGKIGTLEKRAKGSIVIGMRIMFLL